LAGGGHPFLDILEHGGSLPEVTNHPAPDTKSARFTTSLRATTYDDISIQPLLSSFLE